jgi:hypothetical protein
MTDRTRIEDEIRGLLTADLTSAEFSNRVFGQMDGLFPKLGPTEQDRQQIIGSDLWKRAKARLRELEQRDLERVRQRAVVEHPAGSPV